MPSATETSNDSIAALLRQAQVHESAGEYAQSHQLLRQCKAQCGPGASPDLIQATKAGLWRLDPLWWVTLAHGGVSLRRCRGCDASFFRSCTEDAGFAAQFNRRRAWRGDLELALERSGQAPPLSSGLLMWAIESAASGPLGLASLSSIDAVNRRAEFAVGFPGRVPGRLGVKTTLMVLHFALVMARLNKVYGYVYEDNPAALRNAIRGGFVHEGLLQDHFNVAGHGFVSVHQVGLTRSQIRSSERLKTLARRMIGQVW